MYGLLTFELKPHVTSSALLHVGIVVPQKFQLIITNENYIISPKKVWSTDDRRPSFIA
jgi:hypothetical protein